MSQVIHDSEGFTMKIEKGIFYCFFDHDIIIDLKVAERALAKRKSLLEKKNLPILIDFREVKYLLQGAKDLLFNANGFLDGMPVAIIVNSFIIQTSINFALSIAPSLPFKMCVSTQKAEEWLRKKR
jgi:hypothetical protein